MNDRVDSIIRIWFMVCSFISVFCGEVDAQTLLIKSVSLLPTDKTAIELPCLDNNGDTCALLKIKTNNIEGIQFSNPNQYIKTDYSEGIYYVYVPAPIRKIDFIHKDFMPVQLDMADYGFRTLRKGKTYLVVIEAPQIVELKSSVILKVEPKNARVEFDGIIHDETSNGTLEIQVGEGKHSYFVSAENYLSKNGSILVGKSEVKILTVSLQPILYEVLVSSNIVKARVFVDNIDYGGVGRLRIPQGTHIIRLQADGYVDAEKSVNVNSDTVSLFFDLQENTKVTHVHATPVTIYSTSPYIYKNNKRIAEWYNGATILFMPGKYVLSDADCTHSETIEVGDEPMVITLKSDYR